MDCLPTTVNAWTSISSDAIARATAIASSASVPKSVSMTTFRGMVFSSRTDGLWRRRQVELRLVYRRVQFDLSELSDLDRIANLCRRTTRCERKLDSVYIPVIFKIDLFGDHPDHCGGVSDA